MKTIGLIGGMSWESTLEYYRLLNQGVKHALGGLHSAEIVLYSVDFAPIERLQQRGDWTRAGEILASAAERVQAGAPIFCCCAPTPCTRWRGKSNMRFAFPCCTSPMPRRSRLHSGD